MLTEKIHRRFVYDRRMDVLSVYFAGLLTDNARVLDVGCGDGKIDRLIMDKKQVTIEGLDVLVRGQTCIPVTPFDGREIPFDDNSYDTVMAIDVLHHTDEPEALLCGMKRVAKKNILIKDHLLSGLLAYNTLKLMDYVGNKHYGVRLPYNYMTEAEWNALFTKLGLTVLSRETRLRLYPPPAGLLFDRHLHFIAELGGF
jgi:SAM-dependent methyltransferase